MLSWNKIEDRAVKFQMYWKNCESNERQEAQTFEKDFMNIFGADWKDGFHEHKITLKDGSYLAMRLMALFNVLNTPLEKRINNLSLELKKFRYINGNLFKEDLPLASFNENMRKLLLECCMFNWSEINPAIFGAIFQGVMKQEQRRNLGAHYTSEENIMKVLDPLFLGPACGERAIIMTRAGSFDKSMGLKFYPKIH